jgi:folate-binding protein YgfZ
MTTSPTFAEIRVNGADATSFLHSQLANDIRAIEPLQWNFGSYCAADGRVQALMLVARESVESWRLLLPADLSLAVASRLQRYRLRARCTIDSTDVAINADDGDNGADAAYRCECFGWNVTTGSPAPMPPLLWAQQLQLGIPWLVAASSERFLPQMLALERLQAYSLRKGCFPGQEIIARTHYLGRSKRRLVRLTCSGDIDTAVPGSELCTIEDDRVVGTLIAAAPAAAGGLAVVPESVVTGMPVRTFGALRNATFVIEGDVIGTIGDGGLNGRYHPPFSA